MRIGIIVLQYKGFDDTIECLSSIHRAIKPDGLILETIVVDNASPSGFDEIYRYIGSPGISRIQRGATYYCESSGVHVIKSQANRGYGAGNNLGAKYAFNSLECDYVWIINNDIVVGYESIEKIHKYIQENPSIGIFGQTIFNYGTKRVQALAGCKYNELLAIGKNIIINETDLEIIPEEKVESQLDYIIGASFVISLKFYEDVGLFDERFFLYYEEIDLARRARRSGYSLKWSKNVTVEHKEGATINPTEKTWVSEHHSTLSSLLLTKKHFGRCLLVTAIFRAIYKILKYVPKKRFDLIGAHISGIYEFIRRSGA